MPAHGSYIAIGSKIYVLDGVYDSCVTRGGPIQGERGSLDPPKIMIYIFLYVKCLKVPVVQLANFKC